MVPWTTGAGDGAGGDDDDEDEDKLANPRALAKFLGVLKQRVTLGGGRYLEVCVTSVYMASRRSLKDY